MLSRSDAALTGRIAVVTGGGAGIGKGIATNFAAFGAKVAVWEIDPATAEGTASTITAAGGEALALQTDVRDAEHVTRALDATLARFGAVDILVNNVGGVFAAEFLATSEKGWDAIHRANLKTVYHCTHACAGQMVAQRRGGSIINVTSIEGVRAAPSYATYAAAKAGMINFTQTLALELSAQRIRVNAIAPDICMTEGLRKLLPPGEPERYRHLVPLGRAAEVDDVAGVAVFLASDLARYVTGTTIHVDGGTQAAGGWYRDPDGHGWVLGPSRRS